MEALWNHVYVFICSMLPVLELRGAIPLGVGLGLHPVANYIVSVVGNFVPVPFILMFVRKLIAWMQTTKHLHKFADWLVRKAHKNSAKVMKYATVGLLIFVAIPLPATGAWTGALVAAMMDMRYKYALPSLLGGIMVAGIIVSLIAYGVLGALQFLL